MSIPADSKVRFFCMVIFVVIWASLFAQKSWPFTESELDKTIIEAYKLRLNGKADAAKARLEQFIANNSGNAPAHYELARTKYQIGLSNLKELMTGLEDIRHTIEQAIKNDPDNVIYPFFAGDIAFMSAYIAIQKNQPDAKEKVAIVCRYYESALKLKPDYPEAMLYLVEVYGLLPEAMGGDKIKAERYTKKLEEMNKIYGAKARAIMMPEDADYVGYWKKILEENEGNVDVLFELGRVYLLKGEDENGVDCYEKALKIDPTQTLLLLDLARYYTMKGMREEKSREKAWPIAEKMYKRYLDSKPIPPLRAFATIHLSRIKRGMGDEEESKRLFEEAKTTDPFVSQATGIPTLDLFIPVGEISHNHQYLFAPF